MAQPKRELDYNGGKIPRYLADEFKTSDDLNGLVASLSQRLNALAKFEGRPGTELINFQEFEAALTYLRNLIDHWRPWMVCPYCPDKSSLNGQCACGGRGWLPLAKAPGDIMLARERKRANRSSGHGGVPVALQTCKRWAKRAGLT